MSRALFALAVSSVLLCSSSLFAAPTPEQKAEIEAVGELMKQAGTAYKEQKFKESGALIKQVMEKIDKLSAEGDLATVRLLEPHYKRMVQAHSLLELEGIELPAVSTLVKPEKKPVTPEKPEAKPADPAAPAAGGVSFVKQVVPVLMGRCGNCHVRRAQGGLGMTDYATLMKGTKGDAGFLRVIFAGDSKGSTLIEKIVSGEMPPNGKLPDGEIAMLSSWIDQGAKFDGPDENAPLATLLSGQPNLPMPAAPAVVQATGKETISFSRDIAGVLSKNCGGCHGTMRPQENFSVANFTSLLKGGDAGPAILPGKPEESFIVKKLKGTGGGQRMPARLPPLDDATMAKIEKWIAEGAKFDSPDPNQALQQVAALAKAAGSTHEELSKDRAEAADLAWATAYPGINAIKVESENFLVLSNLGENTAKDVADRAEELAPKVAGMLGAPSDKPLLKGRFTLYVIKERYDYTEFGKMIERREIPQPWRGHWKYTGVEAYGVVMPPKKEEYGIEPLIAQQLAGAYIGSLGKNVPRWFGEGVARATTVKMYPADARVHVWDENMGQVFSSLPSADAFLGKDFNPEMADIASYSYAKYLMKDPKKFNRVLDDLRKGGKFDDVFAAAYGNSPNMVAEMWYRSGPGKASKARPTANKSAKN